MMRQALSPRLATRIFLNIGAFDRLEGDVAVLAPRVFEMLVAQHGQAAADPPARFVRHDDVVDEAALPRDERIGKFFPVFAFTRGDLGGIVFFFAEYDLHPPLRPHPGDLPPWPREVDVATQ